MEASEVIDPRFWSAGGPRVLAPPELADEGSEIARLLDGVDAIVFASSGSGGTPKWTRLSREALLASAEAVNRHMEVTANDTWMLALPLHHVGGFGVAARAFVANCGLRRFAGKWNAMRFVDEAEEADATLCSLVPTQVHDLVACALRAPESMRAVVVGGARLDEVAGEEARDLGWPLLQSYGMTETASQVATASLASLDEEFRAQPLPVLSEWEARIAADGCLQVRGAALFTEYLVLRNGHLETSRPHDADGWFPTSDRAALVDGALWVQGRADRQVKILGELVDVEAIEGELREHLSREVELSLLHVPDERRGWRLVPVVARGDAAIDDLVEVMNTRLPGFARLEVPHHVTELPRTALGKVDGAALREEVRRAGR